MKPSERNLQFFSFEHLPAGSAKHASRVVAELAKFMVEFLPENPQKTIGLNKLLEAKDCFVRAVLWKDDEPDASTNLRVHQSPEGPATPSNLSS